MKTLACVSPLIYYSVVTSMQIRKQKETSPAHLPLLGIRCQLPDVWGEQLQQQGEMKHSWQEKRTKIEAYPPSGISFVSFTLFILDSVLSSVMRGGSERGAYSRPPVHNAHLKTKKAEGASRGDTRAVPTSITHLFTCGWHSDDPGWPPNENAHQKPLPSRSLFLAANRLHMGH